MPGHVREGLRTCDMSPRAASSLSARRASGADGFSPSSICAIAGDFGQAGRRRVPSFQGEGFTKAARKLILHELTRAIPVQDVAERAATGGSRDRASRPGPGVSGCGPS